MTESKKPGGGEPPSSAEPKAPLPSSAVLGDALSDVARAAVPVGGFVGDIPSSGLFSTSLGLEADVTPGLKEIAPTFGDVLLAVGQGVVDSQAALDASLVETTKELSKTKVTVVTDVIQVLNDDGLPDASKTKLIQHEVSLVSLVNPECHEWKRVAVSMDFAVGALDSERGMTFTQRQGSSSFRGGAWAFGGWFDHSSQSSSVTVTQRDHTEANWATGQLRVDASLAPRRTEKFTAPSQVAIGPQIFFAQGQTGRELDGDTEIRRSLPVTVSVLKASGAPNPNQSLSIECDQFAFSFVDDDTFDGSRTNAGGQIKLIVTREIPNARFATPVKAELRVRLGAITRSTEFVL